MKTPNSKYEYSIPISKIKKTKANWKRFFEQKVKEIAPSKRKKK